jgi:hypothetical protein
MRSAQDSDYENKIEGTSGGFGEDLRVNKYAWISSVRKSRVVKIPLKIRLLLPGNQVE